MNCERKAKSLWTVWDDVRRIVQEADTFSIAFDYDGTLTPIVNDPEQAHLAPEVRSLLEKLTCFHSTGRVVVAVLSGRSLEDLARRIYLRGIALAGDHGLHVRLPDGGERLMDPRMNATDITDLVRQIRAELTPRMGVILESKRYSISVHYRNAPADAERRLETFLREIIKDKPYRLQRGKKCWEINPDIPVNKGDALLWIERTSFGREPSVRFYVGDDRTDEDVFEVLRVRDFAVFVRSGEKGSARFAGYYLNAQEEIGEFLYRLTRELERKFNS